jgi:uncharacterized protein (TIGR02996 family)
MTSDEAFLADIIAHPDDDAPRLVYADWLEENGQPDRAGFIRAQVQRLRAGPGAPEEELRRREGYQLAREQAAWRERLGSGHAVLTLVRGFVEGVGTSATNWLKQGRAMLEATPLRQLKLYDAGKRRKALFASDTLARLTRLDLNDNKLGDDGVRALAGCAHLANLTRLDLANNEISASGAQALALSPHLANLTVLDLSSNTIGEGATAIATSPHLKKLKELFLGGNGIGDAGAKALAASPNLAGLEELMLFVNEIGAAGAKALTSSPHLKGLRKLYLNQNAISPALRKSLEKAWGERISCAPSRPARRGS